MRLSPVVVCVLLFGCAMQPERPVVENPKAVWESRQAMLRQIDTWELRGRLALRTEEQGVHASLRWVHNRDTDRIDLAGPFGGGRARIVLQPNGAELRDANGKIYRDTSARTLLADVTGWWLPLDALRYWIIGVPAPDGAVDVNLDDWGRLKNLKQLGWDIQFLEYEMQGNLELPRRIFIQRQPELGRDAPLEARFAVESWNFESAAAK